MSLIRLFFLSFFLSLSRWVEPFILVLWSCQTGWTPLFKVWLADTYQFVHSLFSVSIFMPNIKLMIDSPLWNRNKTQSFQCNLLKHRKKVHFFPKTQTKPVITNCTLSGEIGKNKKARFPFCSPADTTTTANYSNFTFIPAKLISIQRAPAPAAAGSTSLPASTVQEFPPHLLKLQTKAKMWLWKLIRGCWPGWTYTVIEPDCGSFELRHYEKL